MTDPAVTGAVTVAWRRRRLLRRTLVAALVTAAAAVVLPAMALMLVLQSLAGGGEGSIPTVRGLPLAARPWVPLVNRAGATFDVNPYLLLGILAEETAYGTHPDTYGANFLGCCHGPFQFNVVDGPPSTWDSVKRAYRAAPRPDRYIHPAFPHPSPYDSFDAAMAAALLLRRKVGGGPIVRLDARAWEAARAYNGAGPVAAAYADRVIATARSLVRLTRTVPAGAHTGSLTWPVAGPVVSGFGQRWGRLHAGIDIAAPAGTPIRAAAAGRVIRRGWTGGYGNFTCLAHARTLATCYAHQSRFAPDLALGGIVGQGAVIGRVGCTGHCFGDHLHFEVHTSTTIANGTTVDPMPYLRGGR